MASITSFIVVFTSDEWWWMTSCLEVAVITALRQAELYYPDTY